MLHVLRSINSKLFRKKNGRKYGCSIDFNFQRYEANTYVCTRLVCSGNIRGKYPLIPRKILKSTPIIYNDLSQTEITECV